MHTNVVLRGPRTTIDTPVGQPSTRSSSRHLLLWQIVGDSPTLNAEWHPIGPLLSAIQPPSKGREAASAIGTLLASGRRLP